MNLIRTYFKLILCSIPAWMALHLAPASWGQTRATLFEKDESGRPNKIFWETEPGLRYDLWISDDLKGWDHVGGYPVEADNLSMSYAFAPAPAGFFKIVAIDEQAPVVKSLYPAANGFAVSRSADIYIELEDQSGIDPASVRLTIGSAGPLEAGSPGLTINGTTISWNSGVLPLGSWGETLQATLVAADTLGNATTHNWTFKLESEPIVAGNIFVFGSQDAQLAGQIINGSAARRAAHDRSPTGGRDLQESPDWSMQAVLPDHIVIAYGPGAAPAFPIGQMVCNQSPESKDQIFYRRVISVSDSPATRQLTLMTETVKLDDMVLQGAVSLSKSSVAYEVESDGGFGETLLLDTNYTFPRMGYDFSGSNFKLRDDGYEATINGATFSQGTTPAFLEVTMSEFSWWLTPRLQTNFEIINGKLVGFEAIATGDIATAQGFVGQATIAGVRLQTTLYDLPSADEPERVIYLGNIGIVPVFGTLKLDFKIKSEAKASVAVDFRGVIEQDASGMFGVRYRVGSEIDWLCEFQNTAPVLDGDVDLAGELSCKVLLEPELEFLVYGLAGVQSRIAPSAKVEVSVPAMNESKICFGADLDFEMNLGGPLFEELGLDNNAVEFEIWSGKSCNEFGITTHPSSREEKLGGNVSFSCVVSSEDPPSFQWYHNDDPIPHQTGRSLFLYNIKQGHAGSYTVRATIGGVTIQSDPAILTIEGLAPQGFSLIPGGIFQMGAEEDGSFINGLPVHPVHVSNFYMGKTEVTKELWDEVRTWGISNGYPGLPAGNGNLTSKGPDHPVHSISWYDAVRWCNAWSKKDGLTPCYTFSGVYQDNSVVSCDWSANGYRLPTDAEWEKAARGRLRGKRFPWGDTISHRQANYFGVSSLSYDLSEGYHPSYGKGDYPYSSPVGSFLPNGYGLYDMAGNVWEMCWDWSGMNSAVVADPRGPVSGSERIWRGGSSVNQGGNSRLAIRLPLPPNVPGGHHMGFRVARTHQ